MTFARNCPVDTMIDDTRLQVKNCGTVFSQALKSKCMHIESEYLDEGINIVSVIDMHDNAPNLDECIWSFSVSDMCNNARNCI